MRYVTPLLPLVTLLGSPATVHAQFGRWQEPAFDLRECATNATHILVVDTHGRVLEVWKGVIVPGERIPVDLFYAPALPRLSVASLGGRGHFPAFEDYWVGDLFGSPFVPERLILFLVKTDRQDAAMQFLGSWLPAGKSGWFDSSTARVDRFGYVWVRPPKWGFGGRLPHTGWMGAEEDFKLLVMKAMRWGPGGEE